MLVGVSISLLASPWPVSSYHAPASETKPPLTKPSRRALSLHIPHLLYLLTAVLSPRYSSPRIPVLKRNRPTDRIRAGEHHGRQGYPGPAQAPEERVNVA
jgi:hypothetical protein